MAQAYRAGFSRVYNLRWGGFARQIFPVIKGFYESTPVWANHHTILDLCCGTGQLAALFLEAGYRVVGLDLSEDMLVYARDNTGAFLASGQARFVQGDASHFVLDEHFGLVVSTYDALNHLPDEQALKKCFECVYAVLEEGGYFIFDLNTRLGLRRWNGVNIDDSGDELFLLTRGMYDESTVKAWMKITGFVQEADGSYSRFDETSYNTVFEMESVKKDLIEVGWKDVCFTSSKDLKTSVTDPETQGRVFIVARK